VIGIQSDKYGEEAQGVDPHCLNPPLSRRGCTKSRRRFPDPNCILSFYSHTFQLARLTAPPACTPGFSDSSSSRHPSERAR
jgi:hypothetical protein